MKFVVQLGRSFFFFVFLAFLNFVYLHLRNCGLTDSLKVCDNVSLRRHYVRLCPLSEAYLIYTTFRELPLGP
jgi:hypothetical protein